MLHRTQLWHVFYTFSIFFNIYIETPENGGCLLYGYTIRPTELLILFILGLGMVFDPVFGNFEKIEAQVLDTN